MFFFLIFSTENHIHQTHKSDFLYYEYSQDGAAVLAKWEKIRADPKKWLSQIEPGINWPLPREEEPEDMSGKSLPISYSPIFLFDQFDKGTRTILVYLCQYRIFLFSSLPNQTRELEQFQFINANTVLELPAIFLLRPIRQRKQNNFNQSTPVPYYGHTPSFSPARHNANLSLQTNTS